jgi:coatomer protein complex subunit alpha (xenin)
VTGLSFHPVRPWILTSLHNGVIQLWDYRMGVLLERFDEHDGPVRGVDFHRIQPLIVSGGDDYKIKVWDYKLRRCLFTLLGHLDYIRTVQFHGENPWIVSASDDQTIRIWNWQSRTCLSVLTGHNHYVMCAAFHPKDDLIVSASLDQTVRVWDTSNLRKKHVRGAPSFDPSGDGAVVAPRVNVDIFGAPDAVVKYVLEGHDRGVNWASFHPTLPLVISGADDRQVKLWRMNETKAWEVDTLRGHTNNVSCVIFHPKYELIISNSEDRSIRVWDISKRMGVQTFRRENDRFWILAAHTEQNLLAAGHDSGMIVFKLERERPAFEVNGNNKLFYVKDKYVRLHEFNSGKDVPVVSLRRGQHSPPSGLGNGPKAMSFNTFSTPNECSVIVTSDADGGSYELISFNPDAGSPAEPTSSHKGSALAAVFIARNRFAVLDKNRQILIKNFQNEITKKITPPNAGTDAIFFAGTSGRILLSSEDRMTLFDTQSRMVIAEIQVSRVKYVVWSSDLNHVALLSKHGIVICDRQLEQKSTITETVRVKSGAWDNTGKIFFYTTLNHIKYCLPNGDFGIIRTLDVPVYITKVEGDNLYCLDRECKTRKMKIENTEAVFKMALANKQYSDVMRMVHHSRLCGQSIIAYLQQKGFPEVALHFVRDFKTRFRLALACGNIEIAMETVDKISQEENMENIANECWQQLGVEALRQGNHQVVEKAAQMTKDFDRLSFLYLITGNTVKLRKMLKISEIRKDVMSRFHNSLYLGDVDERVKVLEGAGQVYLAYLTAATHGLKDEQARLGESLEASGIALPDMSAYKGSKLMQPPTPIIRTKDGSEKDQGVREEDANVNWPLLTVPKSAFEGTIAETAEGMSRIGQQDEEYADATGGAWDDDLDLDDDGPATSGGGAAEGGGGGGSGWDNDLDFGDDDDLAVPLDKSSTFPDGGDDNLFTAPTPGVRAASQWVNNSSYAADHVAAGSFETAMQLLNRQIAVQQFEPLRSKFVGVYCGATTAVPGLSLSPAIMLPVQRARNSGDSKLLPSICVKLPNLIETLKAAYKFFHMANFKESLESFKSIIESIPLIVTSSRSEGNEVKELLDISREYITGIRIKLEIEKLSDSNPVRAAELCAYFTHCNLQPGHLFLALRQAMVSAFRIKNYITAASFAHRLLELPEASSEKNADMKTKAQKVILKSEKEARNEHVLQYNERNPFDIDCKEFLPIFRGSPVIKCAYCNSAYTPEMKDKLCVTCGMALAGVETIGLVFNNRK